MLGPILRTDAEHLASRGGADGRGGELSELAIHPLRAASEPLAGVGKPGGPDPGGVFCVGIHPGSSDRRVRAGGHHLLRDRVAGVAAHGAILRADRGGRLAAAMEPASRPDCRPRAPLGSPGRGDAVGADAGAVCRPSRRDAHGRLGGSRRGGARHPAAALVRQPPDPSARLLRQRGDLPQPEPADGSSGRDHGRGRPHGLLPRHRRAVQPRPAAAASPGAPAGGGSVGPRPGRRKGGRPPTGRGTPPKPRGRIGGRGCGGRIPGLDHGIPQSGPVSGGGPGGPSTARGRGGIAFDAVD